MSSPAASAAFADARGQKRRRIHSYRTASPDTLSDALDALKQETSDFEKRSASHISELVEKFEHLDSACRGQIRDLKRSMAAKDSQLESYSRNVTKLQESNAIVSKQLRIASSTRDAWRDKHEAVFKSNDSLRKETYDAQNKQRLAEERLAPYSTRLEAYREIGQRINDNIIRRVIRLKQIDDIRNSKQHAGLSAAERKELETETKDQLFILTKAWEMLEEDYKEATNGGTFDHEST